MQNKGIIYVRRIRTIPRPAAAAKGVHGALELCQQEEEDSPGILRKNKGRVGSAKEKEIEGT